MLVLLPPSETKRDGGDDGTSLDLDALSFPLLTSRRRKALAALRALSRNATVASDVLGLSPKQRFEIDRNRAITTSPTMPAIDRFTGVLFDALAPASLSAGERAFAADHVVIHSALFGLVGGLDPIVAYRLSHDSRLPTLKLRAHWSAAITAELARRDGFTLDLRSEGYVTLGPRPPRDGSYFLRVVTEDASGQRRALNHFNKKGKGEFVRALVTAGVDHPSVDSLLAWAADAGIRLAHGAEGELDLVV